MWISSPLIGQKWTFPQGQCLKTFDPTDLSKIRPLTLRDCPDILPPEKEIKIKWKLNEIDNKNILSSIL